MLEEHCPEAVSEDHVGRSVADTGIREGRGGGGGGPI